MKTASTFLSLILFFITVKAQTTNVFKNDTIFVTTNVIKIQSLEIYLDDFKDNLKDGTWNYYFVKDSLVKNYSYFISITGTFINSKRHGKFIYYERPLFLEKNHKPTPRLIVNYCNGILDGFFSFYTNGSKLYEGYYKDGKKGGYFINYFTPELGGKVKKIELFVNDTLKNWVVYNAKGYITIQGCGEGTILNGFFIEYDSIGSISKQAMFENGILKNYEVYNNNCSLERQLSGEFDSSEIKNHSVEKGHEYIFLNKFKLINGVINSFNNNKLISTSRYKNGIEIKE